MSAPIVYIGIIQHFFFCRLRVLCSSVKFSIPGKWKAPGTLDLKGQKNLRARKDSRGVLCCSCARFESAFRGAQHMYPGCPRVGGIVGKGGETREERFSIRVRVWHGEGALGRINPMTLSHSHAPADRSYSSSSPSAGCIAARLCLNRERMKCRT